MMHKIYLTHDKGAGNPEIYKLIKRTVRTALKAENAAVPCEVSVYVTDNAGIHALNREYRNVDKPTDVLSFPLQTLTPGSFAPDASEISPETGYLPLGDIVISYEKAVSQAAEFGSTPERETAYLTVHSVLHLLGYDHMDEGVQKKQMRDREKAILPLLRLDESR